MNDTFEEIINGLTDAQKAEFLKILNETGISQHDKELGKLFRVLQVYKSYYEEIPKAVQKSAVRIEKLADDVEKMADRVAGDTGYVNESMDRIHMSVGEAADKASRRILDKIEETLTPLSDAVTMALPGQLANIEKANKVFSRTVKTSKKASAELQKNIKHMKWRHYGAIALTFIGVSLGLFHTTKCF